MNQNEQGGEYLRLSQEYWAIKTETASLLAALRHFGQGLEEIGRVLKERPADWNVDTESMNAEVYQAAQRAERLRSLLAKRADNESALEQFKGVFPPVPFV
jgi:DNA anti-recombination protein RmuC